MNLLTNFHEDHTVNVASRVLTRFYYNHRRKNAPPLGSNVFQSVNKVNTPPLVAMFLKQHIFFELIQDIIATNLLTKLHDDRKIYVTSRVLTRKMPLPRGGHAFQPTGIIFKLVQDIGMNLLTKFHEDRTINAASRVKNAPPLNSHVFQANEKRLAPWWPSTKTILELIQDIIGTNLLTKFHEGWKINVASRVLTGKNALPPGSHFNEDQIINVAPIVKNAPPLGNHVFQAKTSIFALIGQKINVASRVKNVPPPVGHVFQPNGIIFLTHRTINVVSRVENAPPLGSHVFQAHVTIFELIQDIIATNLLTKSHED
ncbi:hypothetical protein DPMN_176979 [Dreissena polymorpha]|uniref:Uncharacterized protein n=1 Tax=Dreissena polymorpha TaxID=45954 RepID=A0A9D4EAV5_DREPO|nr:hypothetical protein DPMN_176979 [Dreissena polymorpha]